MDAITAKTNVKIWGTKNSWSLAPKPETDNSGILCEISLEIQGNQKHGYHLVMSPSGFFTADYWYETKKDALENAEELFGIGPDDWDKGK